MFVMVGMTQTSASLWRCQEQSKAIKLMHHQLSALFVVSEEAHQSIKHAVMTKSH